MSEFDFGDLGKDQSKKEEKKNEVVEKPDEIIKEIKEKKLKEVKEKKSKEIKELKIDCTTCKWRNDHMVYCQNAQCPSETNGYHAYEKGNPPKEVKIKEVSIIPKEIETKLESFENFMQSFKDGKLTNVIVNGNPNPQENILLKQQMEHLTNQVNELEKKLHEKPKTKTPEDYYWELINEYNLPITITYEEIQYLTLKEVPIRNDLDYLIRFRKSKNDMMLYYFQQTKGLK